MYDQIIFFVMALVRGGRTHQMTAKTVVVIPGVLTLPAISAVYTQCSTSTQWG